MVDVDIFLIDNKEDDLCAQEDLERLGVGITRSTSENFGGKYQPEK